MSLECGAQFGKRCLAHDVVVVSDGFVDEADGEAKCFVPSLLEVCEVAVEVVEECFSSGEFDSFLVVISSLISESQIGC